MQKGSGLHGDFLVGGGSSFLFVVPIIKNRGCRPVELVMAQEIFQIGKTKLIKGGFQRDLSKGLSFPQS